MFDTTDQIVRQLRAGEDSRAEFKELGFGDRGVISPNTEDFASEMVAFANGGGGALFLGVNDAGSVVGVPEEKWGHVEQWALNVATHNCDPPIRPEVRRDTLSTPGNEAASVIIVVVPRGLFVHSTSGGRYYARFGSTRRRLTGPELARLFQERGRGYVFDEQQVFSGTVESLDWRG